MKYLWLVAALALAACYVPAYRYREVRREERVSPERVYPLTRADVEKLLQAGLSDAVIVQKARSVGVMKLTVDDIVALKQAGASDELIRELIVNERLVVSSSVRTVPYAVYAYDPWWAPSYFDLWPYGSAW